MKKKTIINGKKKIYTQKKKIRGRGTPYVLKNIIYSGKRAQTGKGVVSKVLAHLLQIGVNIISI